MSQTAKPDDRRAPPSPINGNRLPLGRGWPKGKSRDKGIKPYSASSCTSALSHNAVALRKGLRNNVKPPTDWNEAQKASATLLNLFRCAQISAELSGRAPPRKLPGLVHDVSSTVKSLRTWAIPPTGSMPENEPEIVSSNPQ